MNTDNCRHTLIKIPKNLFRITPSDKNLYAAFLDFKMFNQEGVISTKDINRRKADRSHYRYWIDKLCNRGWVSRDGKYFTLRSYQEVWISMGVDRTWSKSKKRFCFAYKIIDPSTLGLSRTEYRQQLITIICGTVANNKVQQIKWRLKLRQAQERSETLLSCRAVLRLFGLKEKSVSSASRYRAKYFSVIPEKSVLQKTGKYLCKRIAI